MEQTHTHTNKQTHRKALIILWIGGFCDIILSDMEGVGYWYIIHYHTFFVFLVKRSDSQKHNNPLKGGGVYRFCGQKLKKSKKSRKKNFEPKNTIFGVFFGFWGVFRKNLYNGTQTQIFLHKKPL